ncbi:MAG: two-component sensor histidine kinase, partial [Stenotrophomonas maltophilia]
MNRLRRFFSSMVGRLFVILLLGMSVAAIGATMLASTKRQQEFERQNLNRIADRLQGFVNLLDGNPELRQRLLTSGGPSVRQLPEGARIGRPDAALMEILDDRPGPVASSQVAFTSFRSCLPRLPELLPPPPRDKEKMRHPPRERDPAFIPPKCRVVTLQLTDGTPLRLALDSPAV